MNIAIACFRTNCIKGLPRHLRGSLSDTCTLDGLIHQRLLADACETFAFERRRISEAVEVYSDQTRFKVMKAINAIVLAGRTEQIVSG